MKRQIDDLTFSVVRSRRRTADIVVERDGQVIVRAPETVPTQAIDDAVRGNAAWIHRTIAEWEELNAARRHRPFVQGSSFLYLGRNYRLRFVSDASRPLVLRNGWFELDERVTAEGGAPAARKSFRDFYTARALPLLEERVAHRWSFIHAGARKVDGNPHEPLSDRARTEIQADVDGLYEQLVTLVARNRRLAPEAVRATEAAVYRGARAVDLGLADAVGTAAAALAEITRSVQPKRTPLTIPRTATARRPAPHQEVAMTTSLDEPLPDETATEDLAAPIVEPAPPVIAPPTPTPPAPAAEVETRVRAELAELLAIGAQAQRLGVAVDAADAMARGIRPEAVRRAVLDQLAARAEASSVVALAPAPVTAAGESPIVRRARERAAAT